MIGLIWRYMAPTMGSQTDKTIEHEMETGILRWFTSILRVSNKSDPFWGVSAIRVKAC